MRPLPSIIVVLLMSMPASASTSWSRLATHLIAHNEVTIDSSADRIWPYILELDEWKQGPKLEHIDGPVHQRGERFAAMMPDASAEPLYFVENVELIPNRRRTMKLYSRDQGALIGFASWELSENNGSTVVTFDVYAEYVASERIPVDRDSQKRAAAEDGMAAVQNARFAAELLTLKSLVEKNP